MKRCRECEVRNACMMSVRSLQPTLCEGDGELELSPIETNVIDYIKTQGVALAHQIRSDLTLTFYDWYKARDTLQRCDAIRYVHTSASNRGYRVIA